MFREAAEAPAAVERQVAANGERVLALGKRLRAFFVLAGATLFKVGALAALRTASAIEFVHAYSLIHDDLPAMDDDDLRRGRPTCHKVFGEAVAIVGESASAPGLVWRPVGRTLDVRLLARPLNRAPATQRFIDAASEIAKDLGWI